MGHRICPFWIGYLLVNPVRRLWEDPGKIFRPLVAPGMIVLEPGCGMGFFTLPLARLVGPGGRVVAVDLQPKMLDALGRRAARAGLLDRIDLRLAKGASLGVEDLHGTVDLAAAVHMVHEVPEQEGFLQQLWQALRPGGLFLLVEPKRHVSREEFDRTLAAAKSQGFVEAPTDSWLPGRSARLRRPLDAA